MNPGGQADGFPQGVWEKFAKVFGGTASDDDRDFVRKSLAKALEPMQPAVRVEGGENASEKSAAVGSSIQIGPVTFLTAFGIFLAFVAVITSILYGSLSNGIAGLDSKVAGLDSKVAGLDSRVAGLETKMAGLESRMAGLESRMESKIDTLTALVTDLRVEFAKSQGSSSSPETSGAGLRRPLPLDVTGDGEAVGLNSPTGARAETRPE
jgi:hypothetical protein